MEYSDNNSDSEREFDQNELEVALYSQIHFDSSNDNEASFGINNSYQRPSQLFTIGVKELPTKVSKNANKPAFGGEFIAFSSDNCESFNHANSSKLSGSTCRKGKNEIAVKDQAEVESRNDKSEIENFHKLIEKGPQTNDRLKSDVFKKDETLHHCSSDPKLIGGSRDDLEEKIVVTDHEKDAQEGMLSFISHDLSGIDEVQSDGREIKTLARKTSTPKVTKDVRKKLKENEMLLPFSITKAPVKPKVVQTENILTDKSIKYESSEFIEKKVLSHPGKKNLAKLEDFLTLSNSQADSSVMKSKKKASLTKTEAAVKPRKPAVLLRRPPAVSVKYRQDSDTNTDYTDSDASLSATSPLKSRLDTVKDSSQGRPVCKGIAGDVTNKITQAMSVGKCVDQVPASCHKVSNDKVMKDKQENASCSTDVNISSEDNMDERSEKCETGEESDTSEECGTGEESDTSEECGTGEESDTSEECGTGEESNTSEECGTGEESDEYEESSSQEGPIEDSESSDPEDFLTETIPGLEFNLDRGVEIFNTSISETDTDKWKIADRDRHNITGTLKRYFVPRAIQCRNCKADGHLSRDCPQPLKRRCIFCAAEGHTYQACPSAICFNCNVPGHKFTDCKEPKKNWRTECGRCWMPGHEEEHCPDRWRQFHITVNSGGSHVEKDTRDCRNPLVFCYNCGGKGHLGFECRLPMMNKFLVATYPFIARYDTENKSKRMRHGKRDIRKSKKSRCDVDDLKRQLKDKEIGQRHGHNKGLKGQNTNAYHKNSKRHNKEEEHDCGTRKRSRKSNQKKKMKHMTDFKSRSIRSEGKSSTSFEGDHKSNHAGQKRKFTEDNDILDDYDNHQVKNNEWWEEKKFTKKKRTSQAFSPSIMGNDQQIRREFLFGGSRSFHGIQTNRTDNRSQNFREDQQNNRHQQTPQHGRQVFSLEFSRQQSKDYPYSNSNTRPHSERHDYNFSHYTQNHKPNSFYNKTSRQAQLQHAASWPSFQKDSSNLFPNKNGFRARNDKFMAMKRNCDVTSYIRK